MSRLSPEAQMQAMLAAKGNPGLLALASIDLAYADLSDVEREELRAVLVASSVPHWFDPDMLRHVLEVDQPTAKIYWGRLTELSVVERFTARGPDAANVHEASRIALRRHLFEVDRDRLKAISARVVAYLEGSDEVAARIERLYHFLLVDPERAAHELERATGDWLKDVDARKSIAIEPALHELLNEGFLNERAELRARLTLSMRQAQRGTFAVFGEADELLRSARSFDDPFMMIDALAVKVVQHFSVFDWQAAWLVAGRARALLEQVVADDPANTINRSELAFALSLASTTAIRLGWLDDAMELVRRAVAIRQQLVAEQPTHAGHRRELAFTLSGTADVLVELGEFEEAHGYRHRAVALLNELHVEQADHRDIEYELISELLDLAEFEVYHGTLQIALDRYLDATARLCELIDIDPSQYSWRARLGMARLLIGRLQGLIGDLDAARSSAEEALSIFDELHVLEASRMHRMMLAESYRVAGYIADARGEAEAAALALAEADKLDRSEGGP